LKEKKIPLRTCAITREKLPKRDLLRIVRTPEGEIKLDLVGKMNGHGAYVKKDKEVILKAKKNRAIDKLLETNIKDEFYDEVIKSLEENNG